MSDRNGSESIDGISKQLAEGGSRRKALLGLGALGLGSLGLIGLGQDAEAKNKCNKCKNKCKRNNKDKKNKKNCKAKCRDKCKNN